MREKLQGEKTLFDFLAIRCIKVLAKRIDK